MNDIYLQHRNEKIYIDGGIIIMPYLETYFAYGCNLRCSFCGNMSPFSSGFEQKESIIHSLREWSKRIRPAMFAISGGEPLLHPDFIELMQEVRACFPDSNIKLKTNGTLLDRLSDDDLRKCSDIEFYIEDKAVKQDELEQSLARLPNDEIANFG